MDQLSVTIDGKIYRMACGPDERDHLLALAGDLDQRIARIKQDFGEIGDTRAVIMAALMLGDELAQTRDRLNGLQQAIDGLTASRDADVERAIANEEDLAALIDRAAARLESLAVALGNRPVPQPQSQSPEDDTTPAVKTATR